MASESELARRLFALRFPPGTTCPGCQRPTTFHALRMRASYSCQWCGHQVYPTAGTIFHKSTTPLHKWDAALKAMERQPRITIHALEDEIGVSYPTARRMRKLLAAFLGIEVRTCQRT